MLKYLSGSTFQSMLCAVLALSLIASTRDGPKLKDFESKSLLSPHLLLWKLWKAESRHRAEYCKLAKHKPQLHLRGFPNPDPKCTS